MSEQPKPISVNAAEVPADQAIGLSRAFHVGNGAREKRPLGDFFGLTNLTTARDSKT